MSSDKDLQVTLQRVVNKLTELNIPYHLTGGLAVIFYGQPRLTIDIDIVIHRERLDTVLAEFLATMNQAFLIEETAVKEALSRKSVFQALDNNTLFKIDFYPREAVPGELKRSTTQELFPGLTVKMVSLEDAVLSKLLWIQKGSSRSREDVRMMAFNLPKKQLDNIFQRARELRLEELLKEVLAEQEPRA